MELDTTKIDDAVLALLYLGLHDGARAWKGFDWEAMNRLHEQGYITDPRGKAKSVVFTEEGFERAQRLLEELFSKQAEPRIRFSLSRENIFPGHGGVRRFFDAFFSGVTATAAKVIGRRPGCFYPER